MNYRHTQPEQLARINNGELFVLGGQIYVVKERNFEHGYALIIPLKHYRKGKQRKYTQLMHLYKNVEKVLNQK